MIGEKIEKGDLVYLRLESFQPSWRQALVVQCSSRGSKLYMAVRVLDKEIEKDAEQISFFEIKGSKFILVEGKRSQIRSSYAGTQRALEVDSQAVMERALEVLEQQNLHYVTASDDVPEPSRGRAAQALGSSGSSEQGSSSEDEDDKILDLLKKAKKAGKGKGIATELDFEESKGKSKKYPLLEKKKESKSASSSGFDKVVAQTLKNSQDLQGQEANINTLVSLELLRAIQGKNKMKNAWNLDEEDDKSSGDSSSDGGERKNRPRGAGKALRDYREGHKQMRKNPLRHVRRYIREIEDVMGVSQEVAYSLSDYTKKLQWGKNRTLLRVHYAVSEILQSQLRGKGELAALQSVQLLRALHQANLDNGSWKAAGLLMYHQDPLERPRFGGEPGQLEHIASYLKAVQELEKRSAGLSERQDEESGKGKKGAKGKKSEGSSEAV